MFSNIGGVRAANDNPSCNIKPSLPVIEGACRNEGERKQRGDAEYRGANNVGSHIDALRAVPGFKWRATPHDRPITDKSLRARHLRLGDAG